MNSTTVKSHILCDIVHGGYKFAASVSLWIDQASGVAHLTAHSGSSIPLDGPAAPSGAPLFEAHGRKDHITIFDEDEVEVVRAELEVILADWSPDGASETLTGRIEEALGGFDLAQESYANWLEDNDPETFEELYVM